MFVKLHAFRLPHGFGAFLQKGSFVLKPQRFCLILPLPCDDYDDDDSKSYVHPLLQLETVTSMLVIRPGKQFSFQIMTERRYKMAAA